MKYLVDGYNLLHALGLLQARAGPAGLHKARLGLLGLLHRALGAESSSVTVIFDANQAPAGLPESRAGLPLPSARTSSHPNRKDFSCGTILNATRPKAFPNQARMA